MFCNQCEQTANCTGCASSPGVCGKNEDIKSLQETLLYGVKGMCAYANHARRLGKTDEGVNAFVEDALFSTMTNVNFDIGAGLELVLECGKQNLRVMEMLDEGHTERGLELYALALRHPFVANSRWFEDVVGKRVAEVAAGLPAEVVAAAVERGRSRDVDATIAELLAELEV